MKVATGQKGEPTNSNHFQKRGRGGGLTQGKCLKRNRPKVVSMSEFQQYPKKKHPQEEMSCQTIKRSAKQRMLRGMFSIHQKGKSGVHPAADRKIFPGGN